jgi:hypothetical protein
MKLLSLIALGILTMGCAKTTVPLVVKMQTIRDQNTHDKQDQMIAHEKAKRLFGAVSMEERRQRLGQYYTILWQLDSGTNREILFEYQQGKTGSLVKTMKRQLPAGSTSGTEEFTVIGDDYLQNGRILTWRISLISDGKTIASKQSDLWE